MQVPFRVCRVVDRSIYSERRSRLRELLRDIRIEAALRQVDLARSLGQPQSFVSKYEAGERRLDVVELEQVCAACGVSLQDFISRFDS